MIEIWNAVAALAWRHAGPALWQASVVALVVLVAMRLARRWPARVRHALAVIALLKFAVPTLIPAPVVRTARVVRPVRRLRGPAGRSATNRGVGRPDQRAPSLRCRLEP
jgi:hypothetical protein